MMMSARGISLSKYDDLKIRVWTFLDRFNGRRQFSLGDARAYVSALTDVIIAETGSIYIMALEEAVNRAEKLRRFGVSALVRDYKKTYKKWLEIDRSRFKMKDLLHKIEPIRIESSLDSQRNFKVVSLFTGGYGLDLGFELAGFEIMVALDISEESYKNLKANRPNIPFLLGDIKKFATKDILREAGLKPGEVDVITGGPPCQPFSPAGRRLALNDPRSAPLMDFVRIVREAQPKVFVLEEVPGILSSRLRHVPIKNRIDKALSPEERKGSAWKVVLEELKKTKYNIAWKVLNAADYGAPQVRERVIVIGVRPDLKQYPKFPGIRYSREYGGPFKKFRPWSTLAEALVGVKNHRGVIPLPPKYSKFMKYVPPGGNWRQIPDNLKLEAMNGAYKGGGGRMGFYRRLTWFEPSPTLVTSPAMKATMMVHPWEERPLSVAEYLRIQGFPDEWKITVPPHKAYRLIGEAVPVPLAFAIAVTIRNILSH